ncbi:MAG: porin [Pseudomonadota bacterium]
MTHRLSILLTTAFLAAPAAADDAGYALGFGVSADNGGGIGVVGIVDVSFNEQASVFASYAATNADAIPEDIETRDWNVGGRYDFGPIGFEASGGQSGDPDDLDSTDLTLGVFHTSEHWSLSARYLERDIDLAVRPFLRNDAIAVEVPLEAEGWRVAARYRTDNRVSLGASLRQYDYNRDLSPLSGAFIVQRLSPTSLTLASALTDSTITVDVEFPMRGSRAFGLSYARDELAGNLGDVDSFGANLLMPAGDRGDLDIGFGLSNSDGVVEDDTTFYVSVLYLFYGLFD